MSAPKEKDFGRSAPQVSSVYQYRTPPDLLPIDDEESRGGVNPAPLEITDPNHRARFVPIKPKEYDIGSKGGKK